MACSLSGHFSTTSIVLLRMFLLVGVYILCCFLLLSRTSLDSVPWLGSRPFVHVFSFPSGRNTGVTLSCFMIGVFNFINNCQTIFRCVLLHFYQQCRSIPGSPLALPCQHLVTGLFYGSSEFVISHRCSFDLHFPKNRWL